MDIQKELNIIFNLDTSLLEIISRIKCNAHCNKMLMGRVRNNEFGTDRKKNVAKAKDCMKKCLALKRGK